MTSFRGAGAHCSSIFIRRKQTGPNGPPFRPLPFKCPMACPFDQACERHPTPPLSPSTSSGSSRGSSAPSFSPSTLSSLLPRDLDNSHRTCPDSQPLKYRDPSTNLGLMPDHHDDEPMILDGWEEEEHDRAEGGQGEQISSVFVLIILFHSSRPLGLLN